ncbi:MAG: ABC transporter permease [Chloroflexi bacterium]|nr:ABC transporter permease [Chloroflexota bacterium]
MAVQQQVQPQALDAETLLTTEELSQFQIVWRRFRKHRLALIGGVIVIFFVSVALLADVLAPTVPPGYGAIRLEGALLPSPRAVNPAFQHLGPFERSDQAMHILGTDEVGRDILARLIHGARVSLYVGIAAMLGGEIIGSLLGAASGYYGGRVDALMMRVTDFMLTLPQLPILLVLSAALSGRISSEFWRINFLILILVIFGWMGSARLVRSVVLSLREQEFTEASKSLGASDLRIILRHMLPNAMSIIIVNATLAVAGLIIVESALSFLGFGVQPPTPSWGNMLTRVQDYMFQNPTLAIWPGLCIFLTVLSINFVGDGLRDALDPRLRNE